MIENFTLQDLCNLIVLIGAVIIAIKNIYGFFKKPVDIIQDRAEEKEEKHIIEVINKTFPNLLQQNDEPIIKSMQEISDSLKNQTEVLHDVTDSIKVLTDAQMDVMRYNMNRIYYKYRPFKKILDCDKKAFIKFYTDYHSMGGNTWIDTLYEELITWEIVEDESELKIDN